MPLDSTTWYVDQMPRFSLVLLILCGVGCADDAPMMDAGQPDGALSDRDAGQRPDATTDSAAMVRDGDVVDASGPPDASADAGVVVDAGELDVTTFGECGERLPPPGTTEVRNMDGSRVSFEQLQSMTFGYSSSATYLYGLSPNEYSALEVMAPMETRTRRLSFEMPPPTFTTAFPTTVALSDCPGDFAPPASRGRCVVSGTFPGLPWTTDQDANPLLQCILEPGRTYFINIIHAAPGELSESTCEPMPAVRPCGLLFTEVPG